MRTTARGLGVGVELHYIDAPTDELWQRIEQRNAAPPWSQAPISREHLDEWRAAFQPPDEDEMSLFDPAPETA